MAEALHLAQTHPAAVYDGGVVVFVDNDVIIWADQGFVEGCYFAPSTDSVRELGESGSVYFQDEASQLVAQSVALSSRGSFIDVCAAPGGKTTQIAKNIGDEQLIVAGDLHWSRIRLLRATCESHGSDSVRIVQYDAESDLPFPDQSFGTVFVDAPCTGTGTIRHNPEIR
jgi:16S rRNA (cytosine967-C5)-methyltransferase